MFNFPDDQSPELNPPLDQDDELVDVPDYEGEVVIESSEGHIDSD